VAIALAGPIRGAILIIVILVGFFYAARALRGIAKARNNADPPHASDLWCYGVALTAVQGGLATMIARAFWVGATWAPTAIAGFLLAMLLLSIRNAWDLITWIAPTRSAP